MINKKLSKNAKGYNIGEQAAVTKIYNEIDKYCVANKGMHFLILSEVFKLCKNLEHFGRTVNIDYFAIRRNEPNKLIFNAVRVDIYLHSVLDILQMMYKDAKDKNLLFVCPILDMVTFVNVGDLLDIVHKAYKIK